MMLSGRDQRWLDRATRVAKQSTCRQRHGAVLVKGGRVLAVGVNRFRNDPLNVTDPKREASVHAEIATLAALGKIVDFNLSKTTMYIARVNRAGRPVLSKPCGNCAEVLAWLGVDAVWTE